MLLGLVAARGGSKRVPGKNLALLGGRTLVRRALDTVLAAERFDLVALTSDDSAILREADGLEIVTVVRPADLSTDTAGSHAVTMHAVNVLEAAGHGPFDAVGIFQCTCPFTAPDDVQRAVDHFQSTNAPAVVTVVRVTGSDHPLKLKRLEGDRLIGYLEDDRMAPSHELPPLWRRNGALYLTRRETLNSGALLPDDVRAVEMTAERSVDIDTPLDLEFARFLMSRALQR